MTALNRPMAVPLFSGGKAALQERQAKGQHQRRAGAWTARAAISQPTSGASAQAAEGEERSGPPA